jgi:hypothetical protein
MRGAKRHKRRQPGTLTAGTAKAFMGKSFAEVVASALLADLTDTPQSTAGNPKVRRSHELKESTAQPLS